MEDILSRQITGFRRYVLSSPIHLDYVSQNLCQLLGLPENELLHRTQDLYASRIHPADRNAYSDFITRLAETEQHLTQEYRLIKSDGSEIWVRDTASSERLEDGGLVAYSTLTDITDIKSENENLRYLNETIPCGFVTYTCEKQPRVTYINQTMLDLLRFPRVPDGETDDLELYKSNIFLMIPMEERRKFSKYLNRVFSSEAPIAGELTLLRRDGTQVHVFGWVTKSVNAQGKPEFQTVCMDITQRYQDKHASEIQRYIKALGDVYSTIFEFNLETNAVTCLHCDDGSMFKQLRNIAMQIDDALDQWIINSVAPEDRKRVSHFFHTYCQKAATDGEKKPPLFTYKAKSATGEVYPYTGLFIKIDEAVSFFCCRRVQDQGEAESLRAENVQLKENMKELVVRFSDGIAAFEVSADGMVKPLYASENVREFFGYTQEEWLPLMEKHTPLEGFVAYSETSYEEFARLLRNGEAEFSYYDCKTETQRRIKAICSQRVATGSPGYVLLYSMEDGESSLKKALPEKRTVSIRTFGYFDVFVGDQPIAFRNKKSKELLALLVDRRGGYITSEEAIGFLWEDDPVTPVTLSRYRKAALRLKNTLEEYGIAHIVETVDGKRRIIPEKVRCDLYDYLSGKEEYAQLFKGSYLTNYSWGETTLGALSNRYE